MRCTGFTFYGDEDDPYSPSVCALAGTDGGTTATSDFADGPFAVLPTDGISANLGRPPRLHENADYTSTENYAILLGLDKLTDGFYQPLTAEGDGYYARQGFLHTCGFTPTDEVVVATAHPSRVYTVRAWKRCDCCEHRAVGLQIMQQVAVNGDGADGRLEWQPCGAVSAADDAMCNDEAGAEHQFWERECDHTADTRAIKVVRVATSVVPTDDADFQAIDLPEIEAFGAVFFRAAPGGDAGADADTGADDADISAGGADSVAESDRDEEAVVLLAQYSARHVAKIPDDWCTRTTRVGRASHSEHDAESQVVHVEPLITCSAQVVSSFSSAF
jgi:hypothetical protein